jgi:hypothetical protein
MPDLDRLQELSLHSAVSPDIQALQRSINQWVPCGREPDFYTGFLSALEILEALRILVKPEYQARAFELMQQRCAQQLLQRHSEPDFR